MLSKSVCEHGNRVKYIYGHYKVNPVGGWSDNMPRMSTFVDYLSFAFVLAGAYQRKTDWKGNYMSKIPTVFKILSWISCLAWCNVFENQLSIVRLRVRPEGPLSELSNLSGGNTHFTMLELVTFMIHMSLLIVGFCNQRIGCIANWYHWFAMCPRY